MSDFVIPGVTSKYNTNEMVKKLMEVERIPLNRLEDSKKTFNSKKEVWQDLNRLMGKFKDTAKTLYGFQNPFKEHKASSSDESVLTATATRQAVNESLDIRVAQLATRDRFLSAPLSRDFKVPEGKYTFKVGDKEVSFHYNGGRISDFTALLNRRGNGLVRGKLLQDTEQTQVFLLESTKTGSRNKLMLLDDSLELGIKTGLVKKLNASSRELELKENLVSPKGNFTLSDGKLTVDPLKDAVISFNPPFNLEKGFVFEYDVTIENIDRTQPPVPSPPPGPQLGSPGSVTFEGITIDDAASKVQLPKWTPPPKPEIKDTLDVLKLNSSSMLPTLKDTETLQHFSIPASELAGTLNSLTINNANSFRRITIKNIKAYDPSARGDFTPANPVDKAGDAVVFLEGVEIKRPENSIDDLIEGVTLELHNTSPRKVTLNIEPDREYIKNSIISFVGSYNQLLKEIQILSSNDSSVISELDYLSDDEKAKAKERLGMFQGDITFSQMKNRLQQIAMASYPTSKGRELNLLSQIGISTNSGGFGTGIDRTKLRGYLEIDETKLDNLLKDNITAIRELFGNDTDQDLIVDTGAAYAMDNYIGVYTKVGGVIASRISSIDGRVSRIDNDIIAMKSDLDSKEQLLKIKYGKMEGALQSLQDSSKAIDNFSKNSNK